MHDIIYKMHIKYIYRQAVFTVKLLCIIFLKLAFICSVDLFFCLGELTGHLGLHWHASVFFLWKLIEFFLSFNSFSLSGRVFSIKLKSIKGMGIKERKCKYAIWLSSKQYLHGADHENNKYEFNKRGNLSHMGRVGEELCVRML